MKEKTQEQDDFSEKAKEALKESTNDQRKALKKNKFSPVPYLLALIFILVVILFSALTRDTSLQDANDEVVRNNIEAYTLCKKVENIENATTKKYEFIAQKWLTPEVKLQWTCVAIQRVVSSEIISSPK